MAPKEKKTAPKLAALIMREIRELPEYDHIARVAITRAPPQPQIDLVIEDAPTPSASVDADV